MQENRVPFECSYEIRKPLTLLLSINMMGAKEMRERCQGACLQRQNARCRPGQAISASRTIRSLSLPFWMSQRSKTMRRKLSLSPSVATSSENWTLSGLLHTLVCGPRSKNLSYSSYPHISAKL
uniref:Uncharacterized protein n=1 Tax=Rousettus aegyptiacus TaxID=9407 RepID=A0A7J8F0T2_ROUAE|nr:hypothetical protein HJG63_012238 [Rousettus aegyptiacus]